MFWTIVKIILFILLPFLLSVFFYLYSSFLICSLFYKWIYNQSGKLLITIQKQKYKRLLFIGVGIGLILLGEYIGSLDNIWFVAIPDSSFSVSFFLWVRSLCPIEFRDKGVIFLGCSIRWTKINYYEWHSDYLLLKYKTWLGKGKKKIRVDRQQRSQVDFILREKLTIV